MCCRATLTVANDLRAAGLREQADALIQLIAGPLGRWAFAKKFKKPKDVERYYEDCMGSKKAKGMSEGKAKSYCSAVAWSIYCTHKNPDSPHCH